MVAKLVRDKKTRALINTNIEELVTIRAARDTGKMMMQFARDIEQLKLEVQQLKGKVCQEH